MHALAPVTSSSAGPRARTGRSCREATPPSRRRRTHLRRPSPCQLPPSTLRQRAYDFFGSPIPRIRAAAPVVGDGSKMVSRSSNTHNRRVFKFRGHMTCLRPMCQTRQDAWGCRASAPACRARARARGAVRVPRRSRRRRAGVRSADGRTALASGLELEGSGLACCGGRIPALQAASPPVRARCKASARSSCAPDPRASRGSRPTTNAEPAKTRNRMENP